MLDVLQKQESEGEETLWRVTTRDPPQHERKRLPREHRVSQLDAAAPIQEGVSGCVASAHPGFSST